MSTTIHLEKKYNYISRKKSWDLRYKDQKEGSRKATVGIVISLTLMKWDHQINLETNGFKGQVN